MNNKIAFLIHHRAILEHFKPVIDCLPLSLVTLIVEDREDSLYGNQYKEVHNLFNPKIQVEKLSHVITSGEIYKVVVSNHGYVKGLLSRIAKVRVRFMYGIDDAGFNFSDINNEFDLVLTHGPYDTGVLRSKFGLPCYQMGYPKHSIQNADETRINNLKEILFAKQSEPLIAWLPTVHESNSITLFAQEFSDLSNQFNVVVKPHPLTYLHHPDQIALLSEKGCRIIEPQQASTQDLIRISSATLHDFGGTATAAIYSGKLPLFLQVPKSELLTNQESGEIIARDLLGYIKVGELKASILNRISESSGIRNQILLCKGLKARFFHDANGQDAKIASDLLLRILRRPILYTQFLSSSRIKKFRVWLYSTHLT